MHFSKEIKCLIHNLEVWLFRVPWNMVHSFMLLFLCGNFSNLIKIKVRINTFSIPFLELGSKYFQLEIINMKEATDSV